MNFQDYRDIYVFIEQTHGDIAAVGYELLNEAKKLTKQIPNLHFHVVGVLLGGNIKNKVNDVIAHGADRVILCEDDLLAEYSTQFYADALSEIITVHKPDSLLIGASVNGRDLAPRVAARMNTGLTADATLIEMDTENPAIATLLITRPAFGGNLFGTIVCPKTRPQMATIRPGVFEAMTPDYERSGEIICFTPSFTNRKPQVRKLQTIASQHMGVDIAKAQILLSVGRGMAKHMDIVQECAKELNASLAASRAVVDEGIAIKDIQVGQTGKTVRPSLYIACGISGAAQHVAGMEKSDCIIAINSDPNAAIFAIANLGLVGDAAEILPKLTEEIRKWRIDAA